MDQTQAKLERLFEFNKELAGILESEDYDTFAQQEALFGDLVNDFLTKTPKHELALFIAELKTLQNMVKSLQQQADSVTKSLKAQSLSMQRNKKKINAYK